jgi:tetratricopeptide (TPR) repeat protein/SAM-dependent methyltransferase
MASAIPEQSAHADAIRNALAHHHAGRLPQAEAIYRQVLRTQPDHPDALHLLGMIAFQIRRPDIAAELVEKAIRVNPSDATYHQDLGNVLEALGRKDDALASYRKALTLAPDDADTHFNAGHVLHEQARLDEAVASYAEALRLRPDFIEAHINLGSVFARQGRMDEAIASCRHALALAPDSPDLHYNLANALKDRDDPGAAISSYRRAISLRPGFAEALNNLGTMLVGQGALDDAEACYRDAIARQPQFAGAHHNLGLVLQRRDRLPDAIACYRQALALQPEDPAVANDLGYALTAAGKADEAIALFAKALAVRPTFADAQNNLGIALRRVGQVDHAIASFGRAIALQPDFAEAHNNLGNAQIERGDVALALASFRRALTIREAPEFRTSFARCIRSIDLDVVDPDVRRLVTRALSEAWTRPSDLATVAIKLIGRIDAASECIERASHAWPARLPADELFGTAGIAVLADDPLLLALLETTHICDLPLERTLTMARHALLGEALRTGVDVAPGSAALAFHCALARQCFITEYVFATTDGEVALAGRLRAELDAALQLDAPVPVMWVCAVAAYLPLGNLRNAAALAGRSWPHAVAALITQQIAEPAEERQDRNAVPRLTAIDDDVSLIVRQQYEENPYPRWDKLPTPGGSSSVNDYLRQQFPSAGFRPLPNGRDLDILVAGCGTGQESIEMAQQFWEARVLAVDLSLSSLCYARRKTRERGLSNVEYVQGDITKLASIGRRFDVISSVGVLHHLADPKAGWQQLLSLLRPGGLMLLGFYSEVARRNVVAAREFVARGGYGADAAEIRRCRQDMIAADGGDRFRQLTTFRDFYTTSELRDLIFHVQEHRFTLPRIKSMLDELDLDLIGFLLEPPVVRAYQARFPADTELRDLDHWNAFESEFPDTFIGTYAFWAQRRK